MAYEMGSRYNQTSMSSYRTSWPFIAALAASWAGFVGCGEQASGPNNEPAEPVQAEGQTAPAMVAEIAAEPDPVMPDYLVNPPADPRAAIVDALADGLLDPEKLASDNERLAALLETAGVSQASQVLVFSKTSLQHQMISPHNPRAIYFNDDCYIGYVPGGRVEYGDADADPTVGSGFFALDVGDGLRARLKKDDTCLTCHAGSRTFGKPGFFIRSVFPSANGHIITSAGSTNVGHHTPLEERWGGWYVTGRSGKTHHRGNQVTIEQANGDASIDNARGSNVNNLTGRFAIKRYLQPTSDIVALMVLEHQVQMHNRLTQGTSSVHAAIERGQSIARSLGDPFDPGQNDTLQRVITSNANKIVRHLLYCSEIELAEPVVGDAAFQHAFRANRREDGEGRSLKDFDLNTRMFRYRCSYMVYSRAYELMPSLLKEAVSAKLREVLEGRGDGDVYGHLKEAERKAILEILEQTGVLPLERV